MELKDLFVSHKQVDPVVFNKQDVELPKPIYLNRDRAQQVTSSESNESTDTFDWNADREDDETNYDWDADRKYSETYYNWNVKNFKESSDKKSIETSTQVHNTEPVKVEYEPIKIPTIISVSTSISEPTPEIKTNVQSNDFSNLIGFLEKHEGFRSNVYNDSGGVPTIGYGFTNPEIVNLGTIDKNTARKYLEKEILIRSNKLKSQIKTWDKLNKNQQDALISYAYNVGAENWYKHQPKLLKALNEGRFEDAVKYIDVVKDSKGVEQPGLVKRRKAEQELFMS